MQNKNIVLCSASPRRQQLLKELGFEFEVLARDVDETFPKNLQAEDVAIFLAHKKAEFFGDDLMDGKIYITADTIVWLNHEVLNKPANREDAFTMLKKLSGNMHHVFTAVCFSSVKKKITISVKSNVCFRKIPDEEIKYYIEHYKPFDKAGSYGAQECLPEGMNPCSDDEIKFLESINKTDLFERTLSKDKKHFPLIQSIEGSYFNVMGLPIVEVYNTIVNSKF
jgi:septum formation protein